ncbi:unnamed protein product [Closterium sp. NIES-64]|nr:unnamed protein product [Closterium sp. NIES-64]
MASLLAPPKAQMSSISLAASTSQNLSLSPLPLTAFRLLQALSSTASVSFRGAAISAPRRISTAGTVSSAVAVPAQASAASAADAADGAAQGEGTPGEVQEGVQRALAAVKNSPAGTPLSLLQRQLASVLTPFADRLDSRALSSIMKQQEADWRVVLALYDWMAGQGIPRSIHVYTVVLSCLGRTAQWKHLQSVLDDMARLGVPMDEYVYNTLIVAYSNAGRFNEALGWFERMEKAGCMPNQVIYTTVMKLFARAGRTDGVARIAALLREEGGREDGLFRLDSKTICALIAAYNSMGDLNSAQEVFEAARAGTPPGEWDVVVWNAMVATYGRAGKVRQAEELLLQMEAQADRGDGRSEGEEGARGVDTGEWGSVEPDWGSAEADGGGSVEADRVGQSMGETGGAESVSRVQRGAAGSIISSTRNVSRVQGDVEASQATCESTQEHLGRAATEAEDSASEAPQKASEKYMDWVAEREDLLVVQMGAEGFEGEALQGRAPGGGADSADRAGVAVGAKGEGGGTRGGLEGGNRELSPPRFGPTLNAYNSLLNAYAKAGDVDKAEKTFKRLMARGFYPSTVTFNTLFSLYASLPSSSSSLAAARRLHALMLQMDVPLDVYSCCSLIGLLSRSGQVEEAVGLFERMKAQGVQPDSHVFSAMIAMFARHGKLEAALRTFQEMKAAGCAVDMPVLTSMIGVYHRLGLLEEASTAAMDAITQGSGHLDPVIASAIISLFSKQGRLGDAADESGRQYSGPGSTHHHDQRADESGSIADLAAHTTMISVYGKHGLVDKAKLLFTSLRGSGRDLDAVIWNAMLSALGKNKRVEEAKELFADMQENGPAPTVYSYSIMIDAYGKADRILDASTMFARMFSSGLRPSLVTFNSMLAAYRRAGMVNDAAALFRRMRAEGVPPSHVSYAILIHTHAQAGDLREATRLFRELQDSGCAVDNPTLHRITSMLRSAGRSHSSML